MNRIQIHIIEIYRKIKMDICAFMMDISAFIRYNLRNEVPDKIYFSQ